MGHDATGGQSASGNRPAWSEGPRRRPSGNGRPGRGRKAPQGTPPGGHGPRAHPGLRVSRRQHLPVLRLGAARGREGAFQRSAVQTFERSNARTFQRPAPPAGRVGSGGRRVNQRITVLRFFNPQSAISQSAIRTSCSHCSQCQNRDKSPQNHRIRIPQIGCSDRVR